MKVGVLYYSQRRYVPHCGPYNIGYQRESPVHAGFFLLFVILALWTRWARGVFSNISELVPDEAGANPAGSTQKTPTQVGVFCVVIIPKSSDLLPAKS